MNNTLKILKSNFECAEANYSDLRIAVINTIDELNQYRNGFVTDDSLLETLEELVKEIRTQKIRKDEG
jgi:hypothetical protein